MNKLILLAAVGLCFGSIYAKNPKKNKADEGFIFTTVKENPITSIKNQNRSSTCWSFSSIGFLESELLRTGKGEFDLSEMFVVHKTMEDREMLLSLRAVALKISFTATRTTVWYLKKLCQASNTEILFLITTNWML